ncbi:hypothetical protein SEVIR_3G060500v4 [Setaria viridis]|uniref:Uncharacterized protein n=1 Tax=Setaria viridis TaxID=4556 RepID=A0A4V6Y8L8_SETVI|nr:clumping factor B-like [Setaria viridis]TKW24606.1 hypothetical protein SEVIR_3G060500v2 [Setaria viridis]
MDCTHRQPIPIPDPEPPPSPGPPTAAPQEEATGDSESGTPVSAVLLAGDHPSVTDEDDAESCSGGGNNGVCGGGCATSATTGDDDSDGDYVAVEGDEAEVDSWMAVPWWRRMAVEGAAAHDDGGRCAPASEGGAVAGGESVHAAESNRLFWESCIAHGY